MSNVTSMGKEWLLFLLDYFVEHGNPADWEIIETNAKVRFDDGPEETTTTYQLLLPNTDVAGIFLSENTLLAAKGALMLQYDIAMGIVEEASLERKKKGLLS